MKLTAVVCDTEVGQADPTRTHLNQGWLMSMIDKNFKIDLGDLIHKKDLLSGQIAQGH